MPLSDRASSSLPGTLPTQPAAIAIGKQKPDATGTQANLNRLGSKSRAEGVTRKQARPKPFGTDVSSGEKDGPKSAANGESAANSELATSSELAANSTRAAKSEGSAALSSAPIFQNPLALDSSKNSGCSNLGCGCSSCLDSTGNLNASGRRSGLSSETAQIVGTGEPSDLEPTNEALEPTGEAGSTNDAEPASQPEPTSDTNLNNSSPNPLENPAPQDGAEPQAEETTENIDVSPEPPTTDNNGEALSAVLPRDNLANAISEEAASFERSGALAQDAADLYQFSVEETGVFTATLGNLSADADVQLIQDKNENGQIDAGEIVAWEWEQGDLEESIRHFLQPGDYVLRVFDQDIRPEPTRYSVATTFEAAETDDRAFSINVVYKQGTDQLNAEAQQAVQRAANYWEDIISYSSFDRPLELALGLYGTTNRDNPFLAYAGPQSYREADDQLVPVVGVAVLNNLYLDQYNSNPDYLESVLRHEIGHVLGLGIIWDKRGNDLVDEDRGVYRAETYAGQSYGELLGTGVATEVPLDKDSLTHWDEEIFNTELLTPKAEGIGEPLPASQLTISSLRDLGWNVNYGAAEAFNLGSAEVV